MSNYVRQATDGLMFLWENYPSTKTPLSAFYLNKIMNLLKQIDISANESINSKADKSDVTGSVGNLAYDASTGTFTYTEDGEQKAFTLLITDVPEGYEDTHTIVVDTTGLLGTAGASVYLQNLLDALAGVERNYLTTDDLAGYIRHNLTTTTEGKILGAEQGYTLERMINAEAVIVVAPADFSSKVTESGTTYSVAKKPVSKVWASRPACNIASTDNTAPSSAERLAFITYWLNDGFLRANTDVNPPQLEFYTTKVPDNAFTVVVRGVET